MWFVICFRSLTPKLTSRDRDYRKHVGIFFCSRIWIQWVDYSISSSLVCALPYPKLNKGKHGPRPVNFFFFFCCMPSTPCLIFFRDIYLFVLETRKQTLSAFCMILSLSDCCPRPHDRKRCLRCWMPCSRSSARKGNISLIKMMTGTTSTLSKGGFNLLVNFKSHHSWLFNLKKWTQLLNNCWNHCFVLTEDIFSPLPFHSVARLTFSWRLMARKSWWAAMTTEAALENWRWCTTPPGRPQ